MKRKGKRWTAHYTKTEKTRNKREKQEVKSKKEDEDQAAVSMLWSMWANKKMNGGQKDKTKQREQCEVYL